MGPESLSKTPLGNFFIKALASGMESRFRYRFFGPAHILAGVEALPGRAVLELGCGTGFFTLPAAELIGEEGSLTSMDVLAESVEMVSQKVHAAGLTNTRVLRGSALETGLDKHSFDVVLLFGVIPAPLLPLDKLLPEMRRLLKPGGALAVWPPVPGLVPQALTQGGLFEPGVIRNGVHNFISVPEPAHTI